MTDTTLTPTPPSPPAPVRLWHRISPSLVPVLAVLTAMLITIPLMVLTGGAGDFGKGLNIAGTAYSALIEGALGVVVNDRVDRGDLDQFLALAQATDLTQADLRRFGRSVSDLAAVGAANAASYGAVLAKLGDLSADDISALADSLPDIAAIGVDRLDAMRPLIDALGEMDRGDVSDLAKQLAALDSLPPDQRADLLTKLPVLDTFSEADFLADMKLVDQDGIVRLQRLEERLDAAARRRDRR